MNGIIGKNQLTIGKQHEYIKPLNHKIDSVFDICIRDCHNRYFHTFENNCASDIKQTNNRKIEIIKLTISDESMKLYELKKLKIARKNAFVFDEKLKLTIKLYSSLSNIKISYCLKLRIPIRHRQLFKLLSQNAHYVITHCNGLNNSFHFGIRKWMINQQMFQI